MASAPPSLAFASDGSFFEQFQRIQEQQQKQQALQKQQMEQQQAEEQQRLEHEERQAHCAQLPPASTSSPAAPLQDDEDFIASSVFAGARQGYLFKGDERGIGYYKDVGLQGWMSKRQELAKAKPVAIKANKSIAKLPRGAGASEPNAKKAKTDTAEGKSKYLREMDTYRSLACDSGKGTNRPLVK